MPFVVYTTFKVVGAIIKLAKLTIRTQFFSENISKSQFSMKGLLESWLFVVTDLYNLRVSYERSSSVDWLLRSMLAHPTRLLAVP